KKEVIKRLKAIRNTFNGIICIDKIYNYPGESTAMLLDDVKQIIDLKIDSISFYSLMIHEGSSLSKEYEENKFCESQDLKFHDLFIKELLKTGDYELIELTKIVRKNCDSYQYMSIRNSNGNTIPLGKGAGGKIDSYHIYNMSFDKIMVAKSASINDDLAQNIYGMLQSHIISKENIKLFLSSTVKSVITKLINNNYIDEDENNYYLTSKGIFYGNNIGGLLTKSFLEDNI
ncbi:MAG: radical SAM protein, partial [Bacilli bacterium]